MFPRSRSDFRKAYRVSTLDDDGLRRVGAIPELLDVTSSSRWGSVTFIRLSLERWFIACGFVDATIVYSAAGNIS